MKEKKGLGNPFRKEIEELIEAEDVQELLRKSGELHGHLCNYLAYGVKAGYLVVIELDVKSTGMEEVIAIVETNNCFSDGVQMVTGCSFGNNALIYRDIGKTAVTVAKRDGSAIRIVLKSDFENSREEEYPEAYKLWEKIVVRREEATPEEYQTMMKLFSEMSIKELGKPVDEMFKIERKEIKVPEPAPIFNSVKCPICGENVMETRLRKKDDRMVCIDCAEGEHYTLNGAGISKRFFGEK